MQYTGIDLPARARLQLIRAGKIENLVVAFVPALETAPHLIARDARIQTHKCIREIVVLEIILRRKVVCLRLAFLTYAGGEFVILVHVVRNWPELVEKLAK